MEGRPAHSAETIQEPRTSNYRPNLDATAHLHELQAAPEPTPADRERINLVKERLLAQGALTIEPSEGDLFALSRNHVPTTGEGVTIYRPNGEIHRTSIAEYSAQTQRGIAAARFLRRTHRRAMAAQPAATTILRRISASVFSGISKFMGRH